MPATIDAILDEVRSVLEQVDERQVRQLLDVLEGSRHIVTAGAGRVGLATKAFAMRLGHLGFTAHAHGDMTVPSLAAGDLLLVASGSGETPTIVHIVEQAKKTGATVALITANPMSRMGKLAHVVVVVPAPNKVSAGSIRTIQPMTTLNEQSLHIFFDALVLELMSRRGVNEQHMWNQHSNLE